MKLSRHLLAATVITQMVLGFQAQAISKNEANIRGDNALYNLINRFWDKSKSNFTNGSGYWYYAQAIDAAAMAESRKSNKTNQSIIDTLISAQYKRGFVQHGKGRVFYDDENWMALGLIRAYQVRKNPTYLEHAIILFKDIMSAEIRDAKGVSKGIWWDGDHTQVATAANMGAVITGAMLYKITKNQSYLDFSKRIYSYWLINMILQPSWQVVDHYDAQGKKEAVPLTYNQGLAVGAALELYKATGQKIYLTQANGYAQFVLSKMTNNGVLAETVCINRVNECRKNKDLVQFKGITYRYLVKLLLVTPQNKALRTMLDRTAESLWSVARDPSTGLYAHEWDGEDRIPFNVFPAAASAALALGAHAQLLNNIEL